MTSAKTKGARKWFPTGSQGRIVATISAMLLLSAFLRAAQGPAQAIALETRDEEVQQDADLAMEKDTMSCADSDHFRTLLSDLKSREERIEAAEADLLDRAQALNVAESQVREQLEELVAAERELRATMALAQEAAENDLNRLTTVYENMKPADAIPLFEEMTPDFAAGFLGRMRPDMAAAIMSGLQPEIAYSISVILAGRNANVPTE